MFFNLFSSAPKAQNVYEFSFTSITGHKKIPLSDFKGKVILIVNTASHCSFTKQYAGLEKIYEKYKDKGFVVIGVPSNDFGDQETDSNEVIAEFCKVNFGVTFPLTQKEHVSGKNSHPFYLWAKKKLGFFGAPKWNFHKYLINRKGELIDYFSSPTEPENPKIIKAIEKALNEKI
jgi:glutathione peroxidase